MTTVLFLSAGIFAQTSTPPASGEGTETDPYEISSLENLYWIAENVDRWNYHYVQTSDIDASETSGWNDGEGWQPIGYYFYDDEIIEYFEGSYNGQGYSIDGLYINRPEEENQGLFGITYMAKIVNLDMTNVDITGCELVGAIVGWNYCYSEIKNCSVTGNISGSDIVGGIAGTSMSGSVIDNCNFTGNVEGNISGGITGLNTASTVINCFSQGDISGDGAGGLVGQNISNSIVSKSYSTGNIFGENIAGGLVGNNYESEVHNSYSTGNVSGEIQVGGLIGFNHMSEVTDSYSTGKVTANSEFGGLIGFAFGSDVSNSYWDTETSGQTDSDGGEGRTTDEMTYPYSENTYAGWDFENIWIADTDHSVNNGYPYLRDDPTSVPDITKHDMTEMMIYPNPFNTATTIRFEYSGNDPVQLVIYNFSGQVVKTADRFSHDGNGYYFVWQVDDGTGTGITPGVYFAVIKSAGKLIGSGKMILSE